MACPTVRTGSALPRGNAPSAAAASAGARSHRQRALVVAGDGCDDGSMPTVDVNGARYTIKRVDSRHFEFFDAGGREVGHADLFAHNFMAGAEGPQIDLDLAMEIANAAFREGHLRIRMEHRGRLYWFETERDGWLKVFKRDELAGDLDDPKTHRRAGRVNALDHRVEAVEPVTDAELSYLLDAAQQAKIL